MAADQLEQLRTLLAELLPGNRFYSRKLSSAGVTFDVASLEDFSRRFPFTSKQELVEDQREHPPFGTNLTYPLERYTRFHQTSGTSGDPLRWLDTPESWDSMVSDWMKIFAASGARPGDRVFFAFSFGPFIGFWLAFEAASRLGCLCVPGGGLSSVARARAIIDNQIQVLCCTPTYAMRLAEVARDEEIPLSQANVRVMIVAGEPGGSIPAVRARLSELWPGTHIFDHHGMTEIGPASYQCPAEPGVLHINEASYLAEIVEPGGTTLVPPGQSGELIITTLARTGSPVLRYRTSDVVRAKAEAPCACGRFDLALEGGILGRVDDMIVVRGVNVYPSAVEEIVRHCGEVAEYRVTVKTRDSLPELNLEIEPIPGVTDVASLVRDLESRFGTALSLRVGIRAVPIGALPRFEMKGRRWIKEGP